jgi:hypothetical protein
MLGAEPDLRCCFTQRLEEGDQRVFLSGGETLQSLRHDDEVEPFGMREEVVAADEAGTLFGASLAEGEKSRQPAPCDPALGIGENVRGAVAEHEPRAGRERQARFLRRLMGPHHAGHRVAVADADAGEAERLALHQQLFPVGGPTQEREVGGDGELGVPGHEPVPPNLPITSLLSSPGSTGRSSNPRTRDRTNALSLPVFGEGRVGVLTGYMGNRIDWRHG